MRTRTCATCATRYPATAKACPTCSPAPQRAVERPKPDEPPADPDRARAMIAEARAILSCPPRRPGAKVYETRMLTAVLEGHGDGCTCEHCYVERTKDAGLGYVSGKRRQPMTGA